MAYSRWGNSNWYSIWSTNPEIENRDNAIFEIIDSPTISFTAKEIRSNIEKCLIKARKSFPKTTQEEIEELREYMLRFLSDVNQLYSKKRLK